MNRKLSQIFEEVESLEYPDQKDVDDLAIDNEKPEDVSASEEAWAGGSNLHKPVDHSSAGGSEPVTRGQEILKIKESILRQVIYKMVAETLSLYEEVLGEPDLSSEEERENSDNSKDEVNTVAAGGIRGHMSMGIEYDPENPAYRKKSKK